MASAYILYSEQIDRFYVGSCKNMCIRLQQHLEKTFKDAYTTKAEDWKIVLEIDQVDSETARKIEGHIKKMKSRKYIQHLIEYPELRLKLIERYNAGSSR